MDLAQAFGVPETVTLGGRPFVVRQLTMAEWAALQGWLKTAVPSPVTQALRALQEARDMGVPLSPEVRDQSLAYAHEEARRWPPAVGGLSWLRALDSAPGGAAKFVRHVLAVAGHPVTEAESAELVAAASNEEIAELSRVVYFGDPPAPPKAQAPGPTPTPTPTTGAPASTTSRRASRTRKSAG